MKTVIMHQTTSKQNDAANMHHPGFCAIHFHKQHQHNRDGNIFHRVTMNANSALQFAKTTVTIGNAVLQTQANDIKENFINNNALKTAYSALTIQTPFKMADGTCL